MRAGGKRKKRRIQETLDSHGLTCADVARGLGVSLQLVWQTVNGIANNRRVLWRFLELGVAVDDLDLPAFMLAELEEKKRQVA